MDARIYFGRIHIIEWLREHDRKTGRELFEVLQPLALAAQPPVDTVFQSIATRAELVAVLRTIEGQFAADGVVPLLQVETHGSEDGIGVSEDECFDFIDLAHELMPLNQLTGLRLFVVLAACKGIWGTKMSLPSERAAFQVLLGPYRTVTDDEVATAMQAFYASAFAERNGDQAVKAMNGAVAAAQPTFGPVNAAMGFKMVYKDWLATSFTPDAVDRSVAEMNEAQGEIFLALHGRERSAEEAEFDRVRIRAVYENHEANFQEFRTRYFMIDLFAENDNRFPITLADMDKDGPP